MKILLINPNRYKSPPVPPIGLEYVSSCFKNLGDQIHLLDLCFSDNPLKDIDAAVASFMPDAVGMTVRNIDSVLYHTNEFFLDEIREMTAHLKSSYTGRLIIGGSGIAANPQGIRDYLKADIAVVGLVESSLGALRNELSHDYALPRIVRGSLVSPVFCSRDVGFVDYWTYFGRGGIAGFETHKGCSSSCVYCLEANSNVYFRKIEDVIAEISCLIDVGCDHFHLCDSEFNEDLDYSLGFCSALKDSGLTIRWTLYMKPANYSKRLFKLMKSTGVYLITLTVDTFKKCPLYWSDIEKMVFSAKSFGIKINVDLLTGFPYEDDDTLSWTLDLFRRLRPDMVNINTYIRLYKALPVSRIAMNDKRLLNRLLAKAYDESLLKPVFYNHIDTDKLRACIGNDPLFRIEGLEKGVNYCL